MKNVSVACDTCPRSRMRPLRTSLISNMNSFSPFDTRTLAACAAPAVAGPGFAAGLAVAVAVPPNRGFAIQFILPSTLLSPSLTSLREPLLTSLAPRPPRASIHSRASSPLSRAIAHRLQSPRAASSNCPAHGLLRQAARFPQPSNFPAPYLRSRFRALRCLPARAHAAPRSLSIAQIGYSPAPRHQCTSHLCRLSLHGCAALRKSSNSLPALASQLPTPKQAAQTAHTAKQLLELSDQARLPAEPARTPCPLRI